MQENTWVAVLRRIPAAFHDGLILATSTGVDVVMQNIIRMEDDLLILRGRPAGTNDVGKVIVIPYFQVNYITLPGKPSDAQAQAIFGNQDQAFAVMPSVLPAAPSIAAMPEPIMEEQAPSNGHDSAEAKEPEKSQSPPSKSLLLAKLRAKLTGNGLTPMQGKK